MLYIGVQSLIKKTFDPTTATHNIETVNLVRRIEADSIESALGKFILNTKDVAPERERLTPEVYKLETITSI